MTRCMRLLFAGLCVVLLRRYSALPISEIEGLRSLYNATGGVDWTYEYGFGNPWNFSSEHADPCLDDWYGIACRDHATVVRLNLYENNLYGTLPDDLSLLVNLTSLNLGINTLFSTLPSGIGYLSSIEEIDFEFNYISGAIPASFSRLTTLRYLSLAGNMLTGTISASLSKLESMQTFRLWSNYFTGSLPYTVFISMKGLLTLELAVNLFTGTLSPALVQNDLQQMSIEKNLFTGTIPPSFFLCPELLSLDMSVNSLSGQIPSALCNTTSLLSFSLNENLISGNLPHCEYPSASLRVVALDDNFVSGALPQSTVSMPHLERFTINGNMLSSSLPSLHDLSPDCNYLNFAGNLLSGSLPSRSSNDFFVVADNFFSGSIPAIFFNSSLSLVDLSLNLLSGSITNNIAADSLRILILSSNYLSGTIPPALFNMSTLSIVALGNNAFSGSLPPFSTESHILVSIIASNNFLYGTIPPLSGSSSLENLNLGKNFLTGGFPADLSSASMYYLSLDSNMLDGSIPNVVFDGSFVLEYIDCSRNLLSGSLPWSLYSAYELLNLNLHQNILTGLLPTRYAPNLIALIYSENRFTGTLPSSLADLNQLSVLKVQGNRLSGSLDEAFSSDQISLLSVDLSDNRFTGSLPGKLFQCPFVESIAMVKNCFSGELPAEICTSHTLQIMALDGLASACKQRLWDPLSIFGGSYITDDTFGTIPDCVWGMPALTTLHLSGNGLTGNIEGARLHPSFNLTSLSLSHNQLTGTLPNSLVRNILSFDEFDVSHNRFAGVFSNFGSRSHVRNNLLSLEVNRFSGEVLKQFNDFEKVKVLSGNIFQCSKQSDLPSHDADSDVYICGSGELDSAMYSLLAAFCIVLMCFCCCMWWLKSDVSLFSALYKWVMNPPLALIEHICAAYDLKVEDLLQSKRISGAMMYVHGGFGADEQLNVSNISVFNGTLQYILRMAEFITLFVLMVVLPCIVILKQLDGDGTQSHQYGWEVSAAYMSGTSAAIVLTMLWVAITVYCVSRIYSWHLSFRTTHGGKVGAESISVTLRRKLNPSAVFDYSSVVMLNMLVVFIVNGAYIYIQLTDVSQVVQIFSQVSLAGFKLVWDTFAVGAAISWISSRRKDNLDDRTLLYTALLVFNNIIAPCFVTAVTDDTCFKGLFEEAETVTVEYVNLKCVQYAVDMNTLSPFCSIYIEQEFQTSYQPPFNYNYQCSSAILKSFIPVFIYAYTFMILALPVMDVMICSVSIDRVPLFLRRNLAGVMWPGQAPDPAKPLIRVDRVISTLMRHLAVLLTFGFAYPLLGVGVVIAMIQYVWKWRLLIVRYVAAISMGAMSSAGNGCEDADVHGTESAGTGAGSVADVKDGKSVVSSHDDVDALVSRLNIDCQGSWRGAYISLWAVIWPGALFMGCLLFDILGDEMGWQDAIWIFICVMSVPLVCRGGMKVLTFVNSRGVSSEDLILNATTSPVVKLSTSSTIHYEL